MIFQMMRGKSFTVINAQTHIFMNKFPVTFAVKPYQKLAQLKKHRRKLDSKSQQRKLQSLVSTTLHCYDRLSLLLLVGGCKMGLVKA